MNYLTTKDKTKKGHIDFQVHPSLMQNIIIKTSKTVCLHTSGTQSKVTVPDRGIVAHTQLVTGPGHGVLSGCDPNLKRNVQIVIFFASFT